MSKYVENWRQQLKNIAGKMKQEHDRLSENTPIGMADTAVIYAEQLATAICYLERIDEVLNTIEDVESSLTE